MWGIKMSCRYQDIDGKCQLFDGSIEMPGVNEETGICTCRDDPDPTYLCEDWQE